MKKSCPDLMELAGAEGLPSSHPLSLHLRECGRCRASLKALNTFLSEADEGEVPTDELSDADDRLAAFLDRGLAVSESPAVADSAGVRFFLSRHRSWLAAAAVIVVAVGVWLAGPRSMMPDIRDGDELRGDTARPAGSMATVSVLEDQSGNLLVRWEAVEGAQDYQVILWTDALVEIVRLAPGPETSRHVSLASAGGPPPVFLSVIALQGGREIHRSELVPLP